MQSVEINALDKLDNELRAILDEIPGASAELHKKIAEITKRELNAQIDKSGLSDEDGKIKQWQESHVGTGGGYAAVRAEKGQIGDNSPGAITNYLENGHKIRGPKGNSKDYRPRIHKPYVDGYHFYQAAESEAEAKALAEAERYVDEIRRKLEGE